MTTESNVQGSAHLWEPNHPYYCTEGNFYKTGCHTVFESWQGFYEEIGESDPDLNLLFRWDWEVPEPEDLDEGDDPQPLLLTFWVGQRKAALWSMECPVAEADEPEVRAWLETRAKTITALWAPIALAP